MTYFLDSNTVISMLRNNVPKIANKICFFTPSEIKIPSMVMAELVAGAHRSNKVEENMEIISRFLAPYEIIPFDADASKIYGKIWAELEERGKRIGSNDLIIASTVLSRGGILVTNNTKEFERIGGLRIEDWCI